MSTSILRKTISCVGQWVRQINKYDLKQIRKMALIKCIECGHQVSDRAFACPNCGCPIQKEQTTGLTVQKEQLSAQMEQQAPASQKEEDTFVSASGKVYNINGNQQNKERNAWMIIVMAALFVVLVVVGNFAYSTLSDDKKGKETFTNKMERLRLEEERRETERKERMRIKQGEIERKRRMKIEEERRETERKERARIENEQRMRFENERRMRFEDEQKKGAQEKNSGNNNYSKYIGKWTQYIIYEGTRYKVVSGVIYDDFSCDFITYRPSGDINDIWHLKKCVFTNGYVYFTNNGDITIKNTPRFRLGPNGLQTDEGESLVKER